MNYAQLPKIELHLHLDCSLSYSVVQAIDNTISEEQYRNEFVAPPVCADLRDYLTRAVKGFSLMQTPAQLRLVTLDLLAQLEADQVIYAEIRFAPLLHLQQGLSPTQVVEAVESALQEGATRYKVIARLILCTLRHFTEEQSLETAALTRQFFGKGWVAGFDMAGDELGYRVHAHKKAFSLIKDSGIPFTVHAGEAAGPASIWEVIRELGPTRIGHGVRSIEDPSLLQYLVKERIHLEVCPTSNLQTNIFSSMQAHSLGELYQQGMSMSISTDARMITPVTLSSEYQRVAEAFGWGPTEFLDCNLQALQAAFIEEELRASLRQQVLMAY
ncbi:MAG: adenosine deaminase [Sphingomonadales bacterium]